MGILLTSVMVLKVEFLCCLGTDITKLQRRSVDWPHHQEPVIKSALIHYVLIQIIFFSPKHTNSHSKAYY